MPQYEDVYEPPMLDSTGQAIAGAIQGLNPPVPAFISDAFSVERSYSAGDIVIYENKVYIFISSKSAGAWDSTKVTETTIGAICTATNQSLTQLIVTERYNLGTQTIASGGRGVFTKDVSKSGYTPLGIIEIALSNNYYYVGSYTVNAQGALQVVMHSGSSGSTDQTVYVTVLYKKN